MEAQPLNPSSPDDVVTALWRLNRHKVDVPLPDNRLSLINDFRTSGRARVQIFAMIPAEPDLLVWVGAASAFDAHHGVAFRGYQPGCEFMRPVLDPWLAAVCAKEFEIRARAEREQREAARLEAERRAALLDAYRKAFGLA
jgi:hypothetical protein